MLEHTVRVLEMATGRKPSISGRAAAGRVDPTSGPASVTLTVGTETLSERRRICQPEQLEGREADAGGDLFAFGAVV
jgi:hypothetical protein